LDEIFSRLSNKDLAEEIARSLTEEGIHNFLTEIVGALARARNEGDLRPVNLVIEAWYRTLLFVQTPGFIQDVQSSPEKVEGLVEYGVDELRERRKM